MGVGHLSQSASQHTPGYSGIHIKPSHKGRLHRALGVPQGKPIPAAMLSPKPGDSPAVAKEKNFARNAKGFKH